MIKVDTRVLVSSNVTPGEKLIFGTVREIYPGDIVIVELDKDKSLIKCRIGEVTPVVNEVETYKDIITISQEDFDSAVDKVISPCNYDSLGFLEAGIVSICGSLIASRLKRELFGSND